MSERRKLVQNGSASLGPTAMRSGSYRTPDYPGCNDGLDDRVRANSGRCKA